MKRILFIFILSLSLSGCGKIFEDMCGCGVPFVLKFHSQKDSGSPITYPKEIKDIDLYIFDDKNLLVAIELVTDVRLSNAYEMKSMLPEGFYTMVAMGKIKSAKPSRSDDKLSYNFPTPIIGKTTISDLMLEIKYTGSFFDPINESIYVGVARNVEIDRDKKLDTNVLEDINLRKKTKDINIKVFGLSAGKKYTVEIEDAGWQYSFENKNISNERLKFNSALTKDTDHLKASIRTLELIKATKPKIRILDAEGNIIKEMLLLDDIILKNPDVDLQTDEVFDVEIYLNNSFVAIKLVINGWVYVPSNVEL